MNINTLSIQPYCSLALKIESDLWEKKAELPLPSPLSNNILKIIKSKEKPTEENQERDMRNVSEPHLPPELISIIFRKSVLALGDYRSRISQMALIMSLSRYFLVEANFFLTHYPFIYSEWVGSQMTWFAKNIAITKSVYGISGIYDSWNLKILNGKQHICIDTKGNYLIKAENRLEIINALSLKEDIKTLSLEISGIITRNTSILNTDNLVDKLSEMFNKNKELSKVYLYLDSNGIGPHHVEKLMESLSGKEVIELSLARNPIGDEGVEYLAPKIQALKIRNLRLSYTGIGDAGAQHFLNAQTGDLTYLTLGHNNITIIGACRLVDWATNSKIKSIYLCDNRIAIPPYFPVESYMRLENKGKNIYGEKIGIAYDS